MKYFLVGIKGSGMSALAIYLKQRGEEVLGSDVEESFFTEDNLKNNDFMPKVSSYLPHTHTHSYLLA